MIFEPNQQLFILLTSDYNRHIIIIKKGGIISGDFAIKRTFIEIRNSILLCLAEGQKTINQISSETGINWRTVDRHLTYLIGKGWAREVFSSSYVRILELTAFGKDYVRKRVSKNVRISDYKIIKINGDSR
ncbi:ArsR family transcriptional regulator [Candidatus Woesearchaeota archaeon]|nr:ArsR family transcriptional regulator [Candidatus Woesearchaeota archaeon]